jgi:Domain of unknown function (DUF4287)
VPPLNPMSRTWGCEWKNARKLLGVVAWLKADFALGHGHAMAIVALLKGKRDDRSPK